MKSQFFNPLNAELCLGQLFLMLELMPKFCHQYSPLQSFLVEEINAFSPLCFCLSRSLLSFNRTSSSDWLFWLNRTLMWGKAHQRNHLLKLLCVQRGEKVSSALYSRNWENLRCQSHWELQACPQYTKILSLASYLTGCQYQENCISFLQHSYLQFLICPGNVSFLFSFSFFEILFLQIWCVN